MSVTIIPTPPNPVTAKGAKLTFTLTTGNYVRLWCTDAPVGSKLKTELGNSEANRVEVYANESIASTPPFVFQPDKPGRYVLLAQEYQRGASGYGGGYAGDPKGYDSEKKLSESSLTLDFGTRVTTTLGVSPDTATFVCHIFGDSVQATTFSLHGETTPAIIDPKSPAAKTAATIFGIPSDMAVFVGQNATTMAGDMNTVVFDMINKMSGHFQNITGSPQVHAHKDSANTPNSAFVKPTNKKMFIKAVGEIVAALTLHMNTDAARKTPFVGSGVGTGDWHEPSGNAIADGTNAVIAQQPTTVESAYIALSDCWRAYHDHISNLDVHGSADVTYPLAAAPLLMQLHIAFLRAVAAAAPTPAPTENPGVPVLVNVAGFKES